MPPAGLLPALVASIATMQAAFERGDIDEAARQGVLAGPTVLEQALVAPARTARLAAIAAAPGATDRAELLPALVRAAAGPDRRIAIPAARAARTIARDLVRRELPDDLAPDDVADWRHAWATIAADRERWIEVRIVALDTAATLDRALGPDGIGVDLAAALADPDPAYRRAAIAVVPMPVPAPLRAPLGQAVAKDTDPEVALAAAATLCADLARDPAEPVLEALGAPGQERIRSLITGGGPKHQLRDAARCVHPRR